MQLKEREAIFRMDSFLLSIKKAIMVFSALTMTAVVILGYFTSTAHAMADENVWLLKKAKQEAESELTRLQFSFQAQQALWKKRTWIEPDSTDTILALRPAPSVPPIQWNTFQ